MYEGEFENGLFNGYGRYTSASTGQVIEGNYAKGSPVGVQVDIKKTETLLEANSGSISRTH
jgi:hypothetical protein